MEQLCLLDVARAPLIIQFLECLLPQAVWVAAHYPQKHLGRGLTKSLPAAVEEHVCQLRHSQGLFPVAWPLGCQQPTVLVWVKGLDHLACLGLKVVLIKFAYNYNVELKMVEKVEKKIVKKNDDD